jgi:hypothetical protein
VQLSRPQGKRRTNRSKLRCGPHLQIRNVSDHRVILCGQCIESADEPTLWLANPDPSPGQIRNGGMQFDAFGVGPPRKDSASPGKNDVTLNPGDHLDARSRTGILVSYEPPPGLRTTPGSGDRLVQVKLQSRWVEKDSRVKSVARKTESLRRSLNRNPCTTTFADSPGRSRGAFAMSGYQMIARCEELPG